MASLLNSTFITTFKKIDYAIAFKLGVTATLSFYAGQALSAFSGRPDLLNNLWCVLTSIVVLKSNLGGTNEAALYRFLGILIGSLLGGVFSYFFGGSAIALGVGVFITAIACLMMKIKDSIRIASLSVAVVMTLHHLYPEHNPWVFSFFRFLDSTLGILVAMFVSYFLFPKLAAEDIYLNLAKVLSSLGNLFRLSLEGEEHTEIHKIAADQIKTDVDKLLSDARNYYSQTKLELFSKEEGPLEWSMLLNSIDRIYEAILSIRTANHYKVTKIFDDALADQLVEFRDQTSVAIDCLIKKLENQEESNLPYPFAEEENALTKLNAELIRFRETRSTRRFDLDDVENFYVFFYSLRLVGEELQRIDKHLSP